MEEYEYRVLMITNGEKHHRYYYAVSKEAAIAKAEASLIANAGYYQEVKDAFFTGRVMRNGIVR